MNKNIKIIIKWVIGPLLAAWLFYSLYSKVKGQGELKHSITLIREAPFGQEAWKFWLVILLAFLNWSFETRKWQILVKRIQPMLFWRAMKSVLCGVTLTLFTPNRIGEYGGRVLFVDDGKKLQAVSLSIAGSIAQLLITILMGCFGLVFLIERMGPGEMIMGLSVYWLKVLLFISVVVFLVLFLFFFQLSWLIRIIEKLPLAKKFILYISVLDGLDAKILLRLLFLSLSRYIVFVLQYIFMLQLLHVEVGSWQSFWIITVLFWVMAIVPTFAIAELGVRGEFAVALLGLFSSNTIGILGAIFSIWFINLFIPAFIGSILILGIKINRDT